MVLVMLPAVRKKGDHFVAIMTSSSFDPDVCIDLANDLSEWPFP